MPIEPASRDAPPGAKSPADFVRDVFADLFSLQPARETIRRACAGFRDLLRARRCWVHGYPLAYDPAPGIPTPDDATYVASEPGDPPPPPSEDELGALFDGAGEGFEPGPLLVRRVHVNGSGWGVLVVEGPDPAALADPAIRDLFVQFFRAFEGLLGHIARGEGLRSARHLIEKVSEELPLGVFLINRDHRIVYLNRHTAEIARMSREEIFREGCFAPFCDHRANYGKCPAHASLGTGRSWDGETEIGGRHYQVAVRPIRIGGVVPYSAVMLVDDTETFHQRHVLANTIGRISTLLEQATHIRRCLESLVTNMDPEKILPTALHEAAELFKSPYTFLLRLEEDGSLVRVLSDFGNRTADEGFLSLEARARIAPRFEFPDEVVYVRGQENLRDADLDSLLAAYGAKSAYFRSIHVDGRKWGYLGSLSLAKGAATLSDLEAWRDIVKLVEIAVIRARLLSRISDREKELVETARKAEAAARAKTTFLATMSHEIRTPLNAVVGFSETLSRLSGLPAEARECTEGISQSANALLDLINDILDFAKLESGTDIGMLRGECDLGALFREMKTVFRYSARARGIELRYSIPDGFPRLRLSPTRFRQILLNLVGNAVKFTPKGFVEWTASCEPAGEGAVSLAIDVRDTGIGISAKDLETIFDPFVQSGALRPDARTQKGTGLGLPIVRRLVAACGGTVDAESELGKGSVFRVRIGRVETVAAPAASSAAPREPARPPALPGGFLPLLVDDIPLNLRILALHFRSLGIRDTLQAESGEQALELLRARRPSAVFTDLWMPGMDGAALARAIRAEPAFAGVPVVAVTADNDASASFDASVFDDILVKPLDTAKVADCLARLYASS